MLISRQQIRSDQVCLQAIDTVIEEQESFDNQLTPHDYDDKKKHDKYKSNPGFIPGKGIATD
jgi:hypothetical protein